MKRIRPATKIYSLLLLVLTLHTFAHSLVQTNLELNSLREQEQVVCTESLTDNDSDEQAERDDCKPPKHSFIDYSTFFSPSYLVPTYNPLASRLQVHEAFQANPQVYLEIIVPPDSLA
jgi:hypothetical protein